MEGPEQFPIPKMVRRLMQSGRVKIDMTSTAQGCPGGFLKFPRHLRNSPVWKALTGEKKAVWLEMMMRTNYRKRRWRCKATGRTYAIPRGWFICSRKTLADEVGVKEGQVRALWKTLEEEGYLVKVSTRHFTWLHLTNAADFLGNARYRPPKPKERAVVRIIRKVAKSGSESSAQHQAPKSHRKSSP